MINLKTTIRLWSTSRTSFLALVLFSTAVFLNVGCSKKDSDDSVDNDKPNAQQTETTDPSKRSSGFPQEMNGSSDISPGANSTLANLPELIEKLNLAPYHARGFRGQNLRIAVLDNGFAGLNLSLGSRLPPDTRLVESNGNNAQSTIHGTKLAELVYALASGSSRYDSRRLGPQIVLYNTNGYSNLVAAIDLAIADKVDMILYAQVWEYGGNFNGAGFINAQVKKATQAGILWVNAAGNFGQSTYVGPIEVVSGHDVALPHKEGSNSGVRFQVPSLGGAKLPIRIVLSWNDFSDSKSYRTPQDLDFIVESSDGKELSGGRLIQDGAEHSNDPRFSAHAREIIKLDLGPGTYRIRVKAMSSNFDADSLMRIAIDGPGVQILDNPSVDSILIPADNPEVLTIGAGDVNFSAKSRAGKPELTTISNIRFDDGQEIAGTSAASAIAAGTLAVMQSVLGKSDRNRILDHAKNGLIGINMRVADPEKLVE